LEDANTVFSVSDNDFVSYITDEEKGNKLRLEFTDTVEVIKDKLRAHINAPIGSQVNLIEVSQLGNGFCQLLNPISTMPDELQAKDT